MINSSLQLNTSLIKGYTDDGNELSWSDLPKAQCRNGQTCVSCLPERGVGQIYHRPGDVYVVGKIRYDIQFRSKYITAITLCPVLYISGESISNKRIQKKTL